MSAPAFDMHEFLKDLTDSHRHLLQQGIAIGETRYIRQVRALDIAYRKALLDPETKIPSYLMAVMQTLIMMLACSDEGEAAYQLAAARVSKLQATTKKPKAA